MKLSIIIPIYNAEHKLSRSIDSILKQNFEDFELILINDGSLDSSFELCKKYADNDSRIVLIDRKNGGPAFARNEGLKVARGEYILFIDSDDGLIYDEAIADMLDEIGESDLLISAYVRKNGKKNKVVSLEKFIKKCSKDELLNALLKKGHTFYYSVLWNKLYKTEIIRANNISFDNKMTWGEDFCFNMLYYSAIKNLSYSEKPKYCYERSFKGQTWRTMYQIPQNIYKKLRLYNEYKNLYKKNARLNGNRIKIFLYIFKASVSE